MAKKLDFSDKGPQCLGSKSARSIRQNLDVSLCDVAKETFTDIENEQICIYINSTDLDYY